MKIARIRRALVVVGMALAAPAAAWAQSTPAIATASGEAADALAEALTPPDAVDALFDAGLESGLDRALRAAGKERLYAEHPGLRDYVWTPIRAELRAAFERGLPAFRESVARAFAEYMSPAETRATTEFLRTPVGARMMLAISGMYASGPVSPQRDGTTKDDFEASLTAEDRAALDAYGRTGAADKLAEATAGGGASGGAWSEKFFKEQGPHLREMQQRREREFLERAGKSQ